MERIGAAARAHRFVQNVSGLRLPLPATTKKQTEQRRQGDNPAPAIPGHCVIPPLGADHVVASAKMMTDQKPHAAGKSFYRREACICGNLFLRTLILVQTKFGCTDS